MGLKQSRYNLFFDGDRGARLAFNSMTAALAEIEPEKWPVIQAFLDNPNREPLNETEKELLEQLKYGGFLIDQDFDEIAYLKVMNRMTRFSKDSLGLTICPTLNCNFSCFYCYETHPKGVMSKRVQDKLTDFAKERLESAKSFQVTWYGGEPLLAFRVIENLSERFIELCDQKGITYSAYLVTNGYLLSPDKAKRLSELRVQGAQVTLDGPADVHDKRRVLTDGGPTFWRILENVKSATALMRIDLRVNVDKRNMHELNQLLDLLKNKFPDKKMRIYYSKTTPYSLVCGEIESFCMDKAEFEEFYMRSLKTLIERGFDAWKKPTRRANVCTADCLNAFVVLPDGKLYKCWLDTGTIEESFLGTIFDEEPNRNYQKWLALDPFESPDCAKCKMLPICMGGCPAASMKKLPTLEGRVCEFYREEDLIRHLKIFIRHGVSLEPEKAQQKPKGGVL